MDLGINGKNVLVTGASQGIGKAIALEFAKENCNVTVISRRQGELEKLVEEMGGTKNGHRCYSIDLMPYGNPAKAVRDLTSDRLYEIVVHNIGGTLNVKDCLSPVEDWNKVWRNNVGIAIEMNDLLIPQMQQKKWGRVIHISSISAESLRGSGPYAASKAYLNAYTKVLGKQVAKDGIVVSALAPGAIYSPGGHWDPENPMNKKDPEAFKRKQSDFLRHHHAIGRFGTAEEIAPFAVFMASKYVTFAQTSIIPIDGGTE